MRILPCGWEGPNEHLVGGKLRSMGYLKVFGQLKASVLDPPEKIEDDFVDE